MADSINPRLSDNVNSSIVNIGSKSQLFMGSIPLKNAKIKTTSKFIVKLISADTELLTTTK